MMWKMEFVELQGEPVLTKEFERLFKQALLMGLKEEGLLTPMQYLEAIKILEEQE